MEEKNRRKLKVLVAIDGSEIGNLVIKASGRYAKISDCDLTVLNVAKVDPLTAELHETGHITDLGRRKKEEAEEIVAKAQKTLKHYGVECEAKVGVGPVAATILEVAEKGNFDVIFVGSRGFGGIKRMLLGSVADDVIRHAHCSVTVIR